MSRRITGGEALATLHLIVGLPGTGKTTLARELERKHSALRLSPDEWIQRLFGPDISGERLDAVRDPVEEALWDLAARVLSLGVNVVLDFGFWTKVERESFRRRADRLGVRSEVHFFRMCQKQFYLNVLPSGMSNCQPALSE